MPSPLTRHALRRHSVGKLTLPSQDSPSPGDKAHISSMATPLVMRGQRPIEAALCGCRHSGISDGRQLGSADYLFDLYQDFEVPSNVATSTARYFGLLNNIYGILSSTSRAARDAQASQQKGATLSSSLALNVPGILQCLDDWVAAEQERGADSRVSVLYQRSIGLFLRLVVLQQHCDPEAERLAWTSLQMAQDLPGHLQDLAILGPPVSLLEEVTKGFYIKT